MWELNNALTSAFTSLPQGLTVGLLWSDGSKHGQQTPFDIYSSSWEGWWPILILNVDGVTRVLMYCPALGWQLAHSWYVHRSRIIIIGPLEEVFFRAKSNGSASSSSDLDHKGPPPSKLALQFLQQSQQCDQQSHHSSLPLPPPAIPLPRTIPPPSTISPPATTVSIGSDVDSKISNISRRWSKYNAVKSPCPSEQALIVLFKKHIFFEALLEEVLQMLVTNKESFLAKHKEIDLLYKSVISNKDLLEVDYDEKRWAIDEDKEMMKGLAKSRTAHLLFDIEHAMNCLGKSPFPEATPSEVSTACSNSMDVASESSSASSYDSDAKTPTLHKACSAWTPKGEGSNDQISVSQGDIMIVEWTQEPSEGGYWVWGTSVTKQAKGFFPIECLEP